MILYDVSGKLESAHPKLRPVMSRFDFSSTYYDEIPSSLFNELVCKLGFFWQS
jgi:hypothetical protein